MAIPTSRTKQAGTITIDQDLCQGCGLCVEVCKDLSLALVEGKASCSGTPVFGCIACGHCMAICPTGAIRVSGRFLSADDLFPLPGRDALATYGGLLGLWQTRRAIREFQDQPVERALVDKVLLAAATAPMGLPPTDVHVLVLEGKEKNRAFAQDFCAHLEAMRWFASPWFLALMRPFWGKETDELFKGFMRPLMNIYIESMKKGVNVVNYDAPLSMYFYATPYADPADPVVAATYAMTAAQSLGLGTCMLGAVHPFIQSGQAGKRFRERHGIRHKSRQGIVVIMGHPRVKYHQGIRRSFAAVDYP